jgi:hypothetical protein
VAHATLSVLLVPVCVARFGPSPVTFAHVPDRENQKNGRPDRGCAFATVPDRENQTAVVLTALLKFAFAIVLDRENQTAVVLTALLN